MKIVNAIFLLDLGPGALPHFPGLAQVYFLNAIYFDSEILWRELVSLSTRGGLVR